MDDARDTCERNAPQASAPDTKPVTVHALEVADYTLGPLHFATPTLGVHEVVPLRAENYTLGSLDIAVPMWRWGNYVLHWHDAGSKPGGRRPNIPADKAPKLITATRDYLARHRITDLKQISDADRTGLYDFVHKLAEDEGIRTNDRIVREQIIGPALREK